MVDLLNKKVNHSKKYGVGTVIEQNSDSIWVEFPSKKCMFKYPGAFEEHLTVEDKAVADSIAAELKAKKEADAKEEAEKKAKREEVTAQVTLAREKNSNAKGYKPAKRIDGKAVTFLVFQRKTFNEERTGQYIWARKYNKDGNKEHFWDRLMDVRGGDVIFHCAYGYIQAISRARGTFEDSERPGHVVRGRTNSEKDGRKVECDYHVLKTPLNLKLYKEILAKYSNEMYAPFDKNGNGNQGYLFDLNPDLASFFIQEISKKNPEVMKLDFLKLLLTK